MADSRADWIMVEVAAGFREQQVLVPLQVPKGTTALEAARQADLETRLPGHALDPEQLGIFGHRCPPEQVLQAGDRVEIYRPLKADPKEVRRQLAELERGQAGKRR